MDDETGDSSMAVVLHEVRNASNRSLRGFS